MARRRVELAIGEQPFELVGRGVFVADATLKLDEDCELVVNAGHQVFVIPARVVFVDPARGAGLQLECDEGTRLQLAALATAPVPPSPSPEPEPEPEPEPASDPDPDPAADPDPGRKIPRNVHERLRNLTLVQQLKIAHTGEQPERIVLERMYGKNVWEALLRNPRLTGPEVARIARMGNLPRPLIETIVGNGAWLQIPEVRRALLSNPRLAIDQALRILRLLPKHELKLAAQQTAYPHAVRDAARRMLRDGS